MTSEQESAGRSELVAIDLPRADAAASVLSAWADGHAVYVVDRSLSAEGRRAMVERVMPTRLIDDQGVHELGAGDVDDSIAAVIATSGTTSEPKLVELGRPAMEHSAMAYVDRLGLEPGDAWAVTLPLSGVGGLGILARAHVTGIRAPVYEDVEKAVTAGSTVLSLVPTLARRLVSGDGDLSRVRRVIVGGAPLPQQLRIALQERGLSVVESYGMTETWGGAFLDGVGLDGVTVRIARSGRVVIGGPVLFTRYRSPDPAASAFDADGAFHTGDIGHIDGGRLIIDGRVDDVIISGGVSVQPARVESIIDDVDGVRDVCVAGVPSDEWGQEVVAFIVFDGPSDDVTRRVDAAVRANLSAAERPKRLISVPAIARNVNGKPLRRRLIGETIGLEE